MLIFSTKLIVNEELTKEIFINLIVDWLSGNSNYHFGKFTYDGSEKFILKKDSDSLEICEYTDVITVRLVSFCRGIIWTNDYVLNLSEKRRVLAIQLYSDASDMSVKMPDKFNKPRILRQIVKNGYGGMDNNIIVSTEPYIITADNVDMAVNLITRNETYFMPVVYVTYPRYAIDEPINFELMAQNLSGIAHVIVESKEIASVIRKRTNEKNPYAGAVDIFYGGKSSYRVLFDNYNSLDEMRLFIERSVQQKILMTKIEDKYSWMKVQFAQMQAKNEETPELINLYQQLLKEEESENAIKKQHIDELEYQIMEYEERLKDLNASLAQKESQLQTYRYRLEQGKNNHNFSDISFISKEKELYHDEIKDVILKVLDKEMKLMDSDANLISSRKFHVLKDLVDSNELTNKDREISECLGEIIDKSCNLNVQKKRQLIELGFEIEIGTHYKIIFNKDERYAFTLSKTAGDYRSNTNTLKDAVNTLFGR